MVFNLVNQNKAILDTVEDLKKKVVTPLSYAKSVLNKEVSLGNNSVPDPKVQSQNVPRGRLSSNNQRFFRDRSESSKRKRLDADLDSGKNDSQMQVDDTQNEQKDGWNTVKDAKKLRSRGAKVVRGTSGLALGAGSNNFRQGWRAAPREIFVYHTHYSTNEDDIKDLINETSKVEVLEVEKRSREGSYFGSFRVKVNREDFDKALQPEHWPAGWSVLWEDLSQKVMLKRIIVAKCRGEGPSILINNVFQEQY